MQRYVIGPDFVVIGSARSGTTWLYNILKTNEDIYLPPVKEIHFFDRDLKYNSPSHLKDSSFLIRLLSLSNNNVNFKLNMIRKIGKLTFNLDFSDWDWYSRYYFGYYDIQWYKSLFKREAGKISGDITPAYQTLYEDDIDLIKKLFPDLKIVIILRNPIYRSWSQLRKNNQYNYSKQELINKIKSKSFSCYNDYMDSLNRWKNYFKEDQIKILFYDDIKNNPLKLLDELSSFLEINNKFDSSMLKTKINQAKTIKLSFDIEKILHLELNPLLEKINKEFDGKYTSSWLEASNQFLKSI